MAARKRKKESDLVLEDTLDALRTAARLQARQDTRRILNDLEHLVLEKYEKGELGPVDIDLESLVHPDKQLNPGT